MRCAPYSLLLPAAVLTLLGCKATLNASDVFAPAGESAELVVHVERKWLIYTTALSGKTVRFFRDGREIGQAVTDRDGRAAVLVPVGASERAQEFVAQALFAGQRVESRVNLYGWDRDRTIVAVDIDDTISHTDFATLLFNAIDTDSRPICGARETLRRLADDFQILYITARPRVWAHKTRAWLVRHEFPPGPLVCGADSLSVLDQAGFKQRLLAELRVTWPNLLVGIGDRSPDCDGFGRNNMLTVLITDDVSLKTGHSVRLRDWAAVDCYFSAHNVVLARPRALVEYLAANGPPPRLGAAHEDGQLVRP